MLLVRLKHLFEFHLARICFWHQVGDLGLSKVKCQTLISGGVRGTLPWMAPELLNGSSSLVSEKVRALVLIIWIIPYVDFSCSLWSSYPCFDCFCTLG